MRQYDCAHIKQDQAVPTGKCEVRLLPDAPPLRTADYVECDVRLCPLCVGFLNGVLDEIGNQR